jgi:hypothetical protein
MIVVPAGSFTMGSPATEKGRYDNEGPLHPVTIARPFAVSKFNVTFADWDACVAVGGCPQEGRANDQGWGRGTRPVNYVSWGDAQAYVAWLSRMTGKEYRLLTEAEWEYTARAGSTTAYFWGDESGKNNANCYGCGSQWDKQHSSPVGSFNPNAFDLHDMAGNVLAVGAGLLSGQLQWGTRRWFSVDQRKLQSPRHARRFLWLRSTVPPLGQTLLGHPCLPERRYRLQGWAEAFTPLNTYCLHLGSRGEANPQFETSRVRQLRHTTADSGQIDT